METKQELGPLQKSWIAALKSGKYEQGRMYLNLGGKFCCLGVACDISKETLKLNVGVRKLRNGKEVTSYNGIHGSLSYEVIKYFSFVMKEEEGLNRLTFMNDSQRKTFEEMAGIVEENPEHYFSEAV